MISIIVCSINSNLFNTLSNSIESTIGLEYEIIKIDNNVEKLSIAQAYNKGASRAKFEILVFVHEDIVFHTVDWGKILISHFKNLENPGVLGIAGSTYLPLSPCDWWVPDRSVLKMNFLSNREEGVVGKGTLKRTIDNSPIKVHALDGMFLAIRKVLFNDFDFDENLIGFHSYDTSLSYRVGINFNNYVIPNLLIEHFSPGYPNKSWLINTIQANLSIEKLRKIDGKKINKKIEINTYRLFLSQLSKYEIGFKNRIRYAVYFLFRVNRYTVSVGSFFFFFGYFIKFIIP